MRRAARVDANQSFIVGAMLTCGAKVQSLADVGNGVPDLMVGYRGRLILMEIKDGRKPPSQRKLTPDQVKWHAAWAGLPVYVVESAEQALAVLAGVATTQETA